MRKFVIAVLIAALLAGCGSSHKPSSSATSSGQTDTSVGSCVRVILINAQLGDKHSGCGASMTAIVNKVAKGPNSLKVLCSHSQGNDYSCQVTAPNSEGLPNIYASKAGNYEVVDDGENITITPR